ncbi:MAG: hypothetical protein R3322_00365 [Kiloniellales bacterium]|nr:hypothetical protein [Kiloniellales bacterium]
MPPAVEFEDEIDSPEEQIEKDSDQELYDWMSQFGSEGAIRVMLKRISPTTYKGIKTGGSLSRYEEPVTVERIAQEHGGGRYQLIVHKPARTKKGSPTWRYAGARTFDIAGVPRIDSLMHEDSPSPNGKAANGPVEHAMSLAHQMAQDAERRAERERERASQGTDWDGISRVMDPLRDQLRLMQDALNQKEQALISVLNRPADTSASDRLIDLMDKSSSQEANRLDSLRQTHESELRQMRDFNREEIRRREDRHERDMQAMRESHARELATMAQAHQQAMDSQRHGFEMRVDGLKDIMRRLERELEARESELAALRARKEQSPLEQIQGLVSLKSGFDALLPNNDESPKTGWERAAELVFNSSLAKGIATRVAGSGEFDPDDAEGPSELPEGEPPVEQMVTVRRPDGKLVQMPASVVARMQAAQKAKAEAEANGPPLNVDPADIKKAVLLLEAAYRNNTPATVLAQSARNMIPQGILAYVKREGIDAFLNKVATIEDGSPLATVAGRDYVRQVAKFLLEGTTDPDPPVAEESP